MSFYDRDPSVPFWRANVDIDSLLLMRTALIGHKLGLNFEMFPYAAPPLGRPFKCGAISS
jgi:hypothetical protein